MMRILRVALTLVAALALGGCATMAGGVPGDVSRSLETTESALRSGDLAFDQARNGRTLSSAADTAFVDALTQVDHELSTLRQLEVSTPEEEALRADAITALSEAADALVTAQVVVAGTSASSAAQARTQLRQADDTIDAVLQRTGNVR